MKSMFVLAALTASTIGGAAVAEPKAPPAPTSELAAPAPASAPVARTPRYCYKGEITGSRIPRLECHTAAQWKAMGVDVFATR